MEKKQTTMYWEQKNIEINHLYTDIEKQSGTVEVCWAHNPEVRWLKQHTAKIFTGHWYDG